MSPTRWEKAQSDFELALHYIPEDVWTIVRRGQTYLLTGHDQEALADFNRAFALDEKNNWAITNQLALTKQPRNLNFEREMFGWSMVTSYPEDYDYGIEHGVTMSDKAICYIKSKVSKPRRPARLTQIILADEYRGKRLRIFSNLKTQAVEQGASLWMNINGLSKTLNFDNMYSRRLWGTSDWQKCQIVLNVPEDSISISFGILLEGAGQVWLDDLQLEVVDEDIPTTHWLEHVKQPRNLSFEIGMFGWLLAGSHPQDYEHGIDCSVTHSGKVSSYLKARVSKPAGFGTLMQMFLADEYRGKRLRMSGSVKAEGIEQWAGLWMRVDGPDRSRPLSFDNMWNRPIQGTSDWQKYEIVLDIPEVSINIAFGILLVVTGQVWLNEINFEVVSEEIPTTDRLSEG